LNVTTVILSALAWK